MSDRGNKLSLIDACGMAIGGMVGGGIFAVLGEAVAVSGNATFISLGLGGLLALITGYTYSKLTVQFDEPGGSFTFIEHFAGPRFAGTVSWFLMLGYVFTISLYAYTFGAYAGRLFGFGLGPNFYLGGGIILLLTVLNLTGVRESGISEDILVYTKVVILCGLIILGFFTVETDKVYPIIDHGPSSIIFGAALVFVAYEGFQLLTYDYEDIENHRVNLPKSVIWSILIVLAIYMLIAFVLTGSLGEDVISKHKETALAMLAQPILGQTGIIIVLVAAVFSTASAILATIFAMSRLAVRVADDGQLPHQLTEQKSGGVPVFFTCLIALSAISIQFFGNLHQITTFSSFVFLMVFSVVNLMGYKHRIYEDWRIMLPLIGSGGCAGAATVLMYDTYRTDPNVILMISGIAITLLIARFLYTSLHSNYRKKK